MKPIKVSEAKTKMCPFILNTGANIDCKCGDCMAWEYTNTEDIAEYPYAKRGESKEEYDKRLADLETEIKSKGYTITKDDAVGRKELDEDEKLGYCIRLKTCQ
ncbi:MAG TPA: hypothetical protein CFH81_08660 [Sulfurovum sp. UBA12169]|nr:MAG TPA: hypothetical protein CFH81_08660 [Sulfurovum sp. UBA12169]